MHDRLASQELLWLQSRRRLGPPAVEAAGSPGLPPQCIEFLANRTLLRTVVKSIYASLSEAHLKIGVKKEKIDCHRSKSLKRNVAALRLLEVAHVRFDNSRVATYDAMYVLIACHGTCQFSCAKPTGDVDWRVLNVNAESLCMTGEYHFRRLSKIFETIGF